MTPSTACAETKVQRGNAIGAGRARKARPRGPTSSAANSVAEERPTRSSANATTAVRAPSTSNDATVRIARDASVRPMLVSEAVGRTVHALGGDVVFGLMGSGNLAVTNAIVAAGGRFFSARHETGALCMADGYARVSGRARRRVACTRARG